MSQKPTRWSFPEASITLLTNRLTSHVGPLSIQNLASSLTDWTMSS
jgi:hypothetical protein